jgi:hypothetical protein
MWRLGAAELSSRMITDFEVGVLMATAMLEAGTAFSAWWSVVGPERPLPGPIAGGKNGG